MTSFERDIPVASFFLNSTEALQEHWEEVAENKESITLNPDIDKYQLLQDMGVIRNLVVKDGETIVGYSVLLIQPHLHYKDTIYAYVDVIFVKPEYRNSRIGIQLIDETEKFCNELGVSVLTYHTKTANPAIGRILLKRDYKHTENIYGKYLKRG